jgi:hypothetical protein
MSRLDIRASLRRWSRSQASRVGLSLGLFTAAAMLSTGGCSTVAFCFNDCDTSSSSSGMAATGTGGTGGCLVNCSTGTSTFVTVGTGGTGGGCMQTNNGVEVCDGIDNDCNGKIDDIQGLDLTSPSTCGVCGNNCHQLLNSNWDQASVTCTPSTDPGNKAGTCGGTCAQDYWDIDKDAQGACEYYCIKLANDDKTCDGIDDDCDGQTDEDVDVCTSVDNCGYCGHACVVPNGVPQCVHTGASSCDASNTDCAVASCNCNGPGDCWHDVDKNVINGCEYKCDPTNGGVEICDGLDNDCDGTIDNNLNDPSIGTSCFGGTTGVCVDPAHAGTIQCVAGQPVCTGANVVSPGQFQETCNNVDDDCNGAVDDNPVDTGPSFICGMSSVLPCQKGALQCMPGGMKVCVGNIDPQAETCDGVDNDCDGQIDDNLPMAQSGAPCNVPAAPPAGATSPCVGGLIQCVGGAVQCVGSVLPVAGAVDGCKVDANCDGTLTNQPDLMTDVNNCGTCGHQCKSAQDHSNWSCVTGMCQFNGCQQGYYDIPANHQCSYPCIFTSAQELCNNKDDNCDGQIDENVPAPSPSSVCGVSSNATTAECLPYNAATNPGGVSVACVAGAYQCTFHTAGVCNPTCATAAEICDLAPSAALDNNCNGIVNENVPNFGQPCASDFGKPAPGDGVCRTFGTYVCSAPNAVACSATKDLTKAGPELCDGVDNDCDGLVDEPFSNPGTNPTYFVKPVVTQVQANPGLWIYTYESSRPSASGVTAGTGNGYFTSAPSGTTIDKTPSCSAQGKIPWFDVTGTEVDQTCSAMGGHTCSPTEWQTACFAKLQPTPSCTWGYGPAGAACTTGFVAGTKFCNLGSSFDFDAATPGIQNGLLPTGSSLLQSCFSDWSGVFGNTAGVNDQVLDMTGNLREITKAAANQYTLMGGAFDTASEAGAACNFTFYNVDQTFEFLDTGFRCCFSQDPTVYTCGNLVQDGSETDVNCGGAVCSKCASTKKCLVGTDCVSGVCISATKKCQ